MKLRLYHHSDGARIAYREAGTGPPLALVHSAGLSHREFEPLVEELSDRFRLVLPDLPLHGDSEDRPRHPYTASLLESLPDPTREMQEIGGEVPSLLSPPTGCRFHPRCRHASAQCSTARPSVSGDRRMVRCFHPQPPRQEGRS